MIWTLVRFVTSLGHVFIVLSCLPEWSSSDCAACAAWRATSWWARTRTSRCEPGTAWERTRLPWRRSDNSQCPHVVPWWAQCWWCWPRWAGYRCWPSTRMFLQTSQPRAGAMSGYVRRMRTISGEDISFRPWWSMFQVCILSESVVTSAIISPIMIIWWWFQNVPACTERATIMVTTWLCVYNLMQVCPINSTHYHTTTCRWNSEVTVPMVVRACRGVRIMCFWWPWISRKANLVVTSVHN